MGSLAKNKEEKERLDSPLTACIRNAMMEKMGLKKTRMDILKEKMDERKRAM